MSQSAAASSETVEPEHDRIVVLHGATWADFQRMLEMRGDAPVPRFAYLEGSLEIMSPSRSHESIKSILGRLVEAWCVENGVEISPYGSWTLEKKEVERGLEPDECYVLGAVDEPECPDLAIEVLWTSGNIQKLDIYRKLGVREVWFWRKGAIELFVLRGEQYEAIARSEVLSGIDHSLLSQFVRQKPMTAAVRAYLRALRAATPR